MSDEKKAYFKKMWAKKQGDGDKKRMFDRREDDDKRIKTKYFERSKANRDEYDGGLIKARGMKDGMDASPAGAAGSYCG